MKKSLFLLSLLATTGLHAQGSRPQWGNLTPGSFDVGVRVIQTWDYSRAYWPRRDWRGQERQGEAARPIQIVVWYPVARTPRAGAATASGTMTFGDYLDFWAGELGGRSEELKAYKINEYRRGPFSPLYPNGMPDSVWARVIGVPTAARRDAAAAPGTFPLLIQAGIGGAAAQSVMHEYLASHGYVIASVPFLNTSPAWHDRGEWTALALDEEVRDIGFILSQVRELPFVNRSKLAVVGMGAHAGLLFQMRTGLLDAVAMLDVSFPDAMRQLSYYNPRAVRIPLLDMPNTEYPRDEALLDSLPYADKFLVRFREMPHVDFYQFSKVSKPEESRQRPNYEILSRYTRMFLDAALKGDSSARRSLLTGPEANGLAAGFLTTTHRTALPAAPTEAEFLTMVRYQGIQPAIAVYREVKARDPAARLFSIDGLRTVGLFLARSGGVPAATAAMDLVAEAYPDSAKSHFFLGDWYARGNLRDDARRYYQAALAKLPGDTSLNAREKEQLDRETKERLASLQP